MGFVTLRGYEALLPDATITELRAAATRFFERTPQAAKLRCHVDGVYGFLDVGEEVTPPFPVYSRYSRALQDMLHRRGAVFLLATLQAHRVNHA